MARFQWDRAVIRRRDVEPGTGWSDHIESAAIDETGSRNQRRIPRPSMGREDRSIVRWASRRRRFVRPLSTITQTDTVTASQPRPLAICAASRRFRSTPPSSSFTWAMSVLSSITSSARRFGLEREDVDHPAFAVDTERRLGREEPFGEVLAERARDRLVQLRVARVQEPVQVACAPPRVQVHAHVEGRGNRADRVERQRADVPPLGPRDRRRRDLRLASEVLLPPATPPAQLPKRRPEPQAIHDPRTVTEAALPSVIRRSTGAHHGWPVAVAGRRDRSPWPVAVVGRRGRSP